MSSSSSTLPVIDEKFIFSHRPIAWLHTNERNYPMDIEQYLSKCTLHTQANIVGDFRQKGKRINVETLAKRIDAQGKAIVVEPNEVLSSEFFDGFQPAPDQGLLTLEIRPENAHWNRGETDLSQIPVYVYVPPERVNGKRYIHYIFFYAFNDSFPVFFNAFPMGAHDADIEHITLEVDATNLEIERVFYGAHGQGDGKWVRWSKVEKWQNTERPVVYIAKGSHACYPKPGYFVRFAGAANDSCNRGTLWDVETFQLIVDKMDTKGNAHPQYDPKTMGFLNYNGDWGFGQVSSLRWKSWWTAEGASKEKENHAPLRSAFNFRLDIFIVSLFFLVFFIMAIIGWVKWSKWRRVMRKMVKNI